jgi:hypothetical protein
VVEVQLRVAPNQVKQREKAAARDDRSSAVSPKERTPDESPSREPEAIPDTGH